MHGREMGHSASTTRNNSVAIGIWCWRWRRRFLNLWSFGTIFGLGIGRGPAQVLLAHVAALLSGASAVFGSFGANAKKAFSSDVLLALIYSYPLFAVAVLTSSSRSIAAGLYRRGRADGAGLVRAVGLRDLQGMRGFSFGAGTAPRMFGVLMLALGAGIALIGLFTEGPGHFPLCLARPVIRLAGDFVLCAGDPAARCDRHGVRELHDRSARHA